MPTPLLSIRIPAEHHELFKRLAAAVRADQCFAGHLEATLDADQALRDSMPDVIFASNDVRSDIERLSDDVRVLSQRLAALEQTAAASTPARPRPVSAAAATLRLSEAERERLRQAVAHHSRGVAGVADSVGVNRSALRRALAGEALARANLMRIRRFLDHLAPS